MLTLTLRGRSSKRFQWGGNPIKCRGENGTQGAHFADRKGRLQPTLQHGLNLPLSLTLWLISFCYN